MEDTSVLVVSDIHYAGAAEKQRPNFELSSVKNPWTRTLLGWHRRYFWLRDPFAHNHLLDHVLDYPNPVDWVVANGDFSCDSGFIGVADDAAFSSAAECLSRLRTRFSPRFQATIGDHELGKKSLGGGQGGMRIASWNRAVQDLQLEPFWRIELGDYVLTGVASSLVALPVFAPETLPNEGSAWMELRERHLEQIRGHFESLSPRQRVVLFCHDPTALPFLFQMPIIRQKCSQISATIIGHLHTEIILFKSRLLAGMPAIPFLGNSIRRMSTALNQAACWKPFRIRLCPALAGIELLKKGGFLTLSLPVDPARPVRFRAHDFRR